MLLCLSSTDKPWSVIRCQTAAEGFVLGRFSSSPEVPALEHHSTPGLLSRRHCRLQLRSDGLITVEDLKSLNGTWVEGLSTPADGQQVVQQGAVQLEPFVPHVLQAGESLMLGGKDTVQGVGRSRVPNPFKFLFTPAVPSAAAGTVGAGAQAAAAATDTAVQQQHQREASGAGAVHTSMHHSQQQQDKPTASLDHTVKRSALQDAVTSNIQQQQQQLPGSSSQQAAAAAMQAAVTDTAHYQPRTTSVVGVVEPATKRRRLPASAADAKTVSRQLESPPVQPLPEETTPAAELAERPGLVAAAGAAGAESSRQPSASRKRSIAQLQHMAGPHRPAAPAAANPVIEAAQGADAAAAAAAAWSDDALILGTTLSAEAAARRGPETAAAGSDSITQSMASSRQHGTAQHQHTPRQHHTAVLAATGTANTPLVDPAIETAQATTAAAAAAAAAAATGSDEAIIIASDDSDFLLPRHGRRLRSTPQRAAAAAAARRAAVAAGSADTDAAAAGSCPAPGGAAVHAAAAGCADLPAAAAANITSPAAAARTTPMRGQLVGAPDAAAATPPVARRSPRIQQQQQRPPSSSSKDVRKISISNLECGICKMLLVGPHVLHCGHHYCGMCLAQWLQAHSPPTCPCCRATVQSAPVHTFVLVQLVAEAMAKSGSEEQDFALRQETWEAIKEDTTAQWQEMFSRGGGGRGHEAPQNQPARPAAAAAGRGGSRGRRGAGRTQQQQQRPQQQQRAVERVQLGTGDMHLLNGLMMPAGPMAAAAAAAAAGGGGVGMRAAGSARGPARAAAGAAAGARGRPQQGRGRQRGRNRQRQQQQQQQQQLFQQQQQALAAAAAAAAAAARTAAMQAPAPSRPRAAGAAARPAAQRHATAGRNGGGLQGPNAADRQLRQMGIDAFIR